jgi:hypothetical protein
MKSAKSVFLRGRTIAIGLAVARLLDFYFGKKVQRLVKVIPFFRFSPLSHPFVRNDQRAEKRVRNDSIVMRNEHFVMMSRRIHMRNDR